MHLFRIALYGAGIYYALFVDNRILFPFFGIVSLYLIASATIEKGEKISTRKAIMQATWAEPYCPNIHIRVPVRTEKVEKIIASMPKQNKLTITHFCLKALGEVLVAHPQLNGVITMGKFWPKESVNIGCLVDIESGKDLTVLNINGVEDMFLEDISLYIKDRARVIKREGGGEQHKKSIQSTKYLPAFFVQFISQFIFFLSFKLRLNLTMIGLNNNSFGTAAITYVGGLGFQDSTSPFNNPSNWTILLTVNAVTRQPVVEGGEVAMGNVMICNFLVDSRYIRIENCSKLSSVFRKVFEQPQNYLHSAGRTEQL